MKLAATTQRLILTAIFTFIAPSVFAQGAVTGEVRTFATEMCPTGWEMADGSSTLIEDAPDLFEAIGTRFGGDGVEEFNLPDLAGRVVVGAGTADSGFEYALGDVGGEEKTRSSSIKVRKSPYDYYSGYYGNHETPESDEGPHDPSKYRPLY